MVSMRAHPNYASRQPPFYPPLHFPVIPVRIYTSIVRAGNPNAGLRKYADPGCENIQLFQRPFGRRLCLAFANLARSLGLEVLVGAAPCSVLAIVYLKIEGGEGVVAEMQKGKPAASFFWHRLLVAATCDDDDSARARVWRLPLMANVPFLIETLSLQ